MTYTNNYGGEQFLPNIEITGEPGVYFFDLESGIGKTYLLKSLKEVASFKDTIAYTYNDRLFLKDLKALVNEYRDNLKVIMLDRYDMYKNEFVDIIDSLADKCIVLIDVKEYEDVQCEFTGWAGIKRTEDSIKVICFKD